MKKNKLVMNKYGGRCKIKQSALYFISIFLLLFIFASVSVYPDTIINKEDKQNFNQNHSGFIHNLDYLNSFNSSDELNIYKLSGHIPEQKDPFVAGFLSWLMMGVGQIYCKEYTRGSIFIALDLLDKGALVAVTSYVNKKYSPKGEEIININWSNFDPNTKLLIISYIIAKYGIRFYNVYDAIQAAKNYNKIHFINREKSRVSFDVNSDSLQIGYSIKFK